LNKEPIVVIAGVESRAFYQALQVEEERLHFCSAEDGAKLFGNCGAALLIIDCGVDAERGLQLLLTAKQNYPSLPVIFLTDASSEEVVIRAFKAGTREYFKKPVTVAELQGTMVELLRLRRSVSETRESLCLHVKSLLAGTGLQPSTDLPEGLLRTVRYLADNLCREIYLDNLAGEAGMSKYHFCRVFKCHLGMSPMQFLAAMRIERAKLMLRRPELTVASIAFKVGFNDISDFIRQFKRQTGATPTAYKDSLR